ATASQPHRIWVGISKFLDDLFLLFVSQPAELGDLNRNLLDLFGRQLRHKLRRLVLWEAHQQDRGFAKVGHGAGDRSPEVKRQQPRAPSRLRCAAVPGIRYAGLRGVSAKKPLAVES